jgi:uncharacterized protein
MNQKLEEITKRALPVLQKHNVVFAGVFGSYARGEEQKGSDIDFLVRYGRKVSLFEAVRAEQELSEQLNLQVDLISEKALHPYIKDNVYKDLITIYGTR